MREVIAKLFHEIVDTQGKEVTAQWVPLLSAVNTVNLCHHLPLVHDHKLGALGIHISGEAKQVREPILYLGQQLAALGAVVAILVVNLESGRHLIPEISPIPSPILLLKLVKLCF